MLPIYVATFLGVVCLALMGWVIYNIWTTRQFSTGNAIGLLAAVATMLPVVLSPPIFPPPPPTPLPKIIFQDNFTSNENNWSEISKLFEYDTYTATTNIVDDKLKREMFTTDKSKGNWGGAFIPDLIVKDFSLVVDSKIVDSSNDAAITIIFRETNDPRNYARVAFKNDGTFYVVMQHDEGGRTLHKQKLGNGIIFNNGVTNTIELSAKDEELFITINDEFLGKVDIPISDAGRIRLGTELFDSNQFIIAEFDNLVVSEK